jgi:hypothetical protein
MADVRGQIGGQKKGLSGGEAAAGPKGGCRVFGYRLPFFSMGAMCV